MTDSDLIFATIFLVAFFLGVLCALLRWTDAAENRTVLLAIVGILGVVMVYVLMSGEMLEVDSSYLYSFHAFFLSLGIVTWFLVGLTLSSKLLARNRTDD